MVSSSGSSQARVTESWLTAPVVNPVGWAGADSGLTTTILRPDQSEAPLSFTDRTPKKYCPWSGSPDISALEPSKEMVKP